MSNVEMVPFHGDVLQATKNDGGVWVPLRSMCDNLGLALQSQLAKLRTKPWAVVTMNVMTGADGKSYNWKHGGYFDRAGQGPKRGGPPAHRAIVIGRPMTIDLRESVREDARTGSHCAPAFQTLVRGHLKRQVVGIGRSGRKVIWVEPYWRGPEDAPILTRPIRVGASQ